MRVVPIKANFKKILESVIGKRILHVRRALSGLEEFSRAATRESVKFEPPGPKIEILTTNDLDSKTGRLYPDYKERRAARKVKEQEIIDLGDCYLDD